MAHSYSGESLEDLDAMRMSSASFAAALAEAEAIAANVAASMQQHQQQQAANAAAAAARGAAGPDGKLEGSSMQTDR
jgi:nicotinamide mononucleotide (NMN) deamidase PncC